MPYLQIMSSVAVRPDKREDFLKACTNLVSQSLGKPMAYVMVSLDQTHMMMGEVEDPAVMVELRSLGGLSPEKNKELSEALCDAVELYLQIDPERIFINFFDLPRSHWGWNRNTFG